MQVAIFGCCITSWMLYCYDRMSRSTLKISFEDPASGFILHSVQLFLNPWVHPAWMASFFFFYIYQRNNPSDFIFLMQFVFVFISHSLALAWCINTFISTASRLYHISSAFSTFFLHSVSILCLISIVWLHLFCKLHPITSLFSVLVLFIPPSCEDVPII